jgi:hypothetical protein
MSQPQLLRIVGGWLAKGEGWAVSGRTVEEALERFSQAEERHARIDAQPYLYERLLEDSARDPAPAPPSAGGEGT